MLPRLFTTFRSRPAQIAIVVVFAVAAFITARRLTRPTYTAPIFPESDTPQAAEIRRALYAELQPVQLVNCELARFGEPNDGGYLLCANLLDQVMAAYSYGISGYDQWGCDLSTRRHIPVHQYDCFDPERPSCAGGDTRFHEECVGAAASVDSSARRFDTLERQLAANGDADAHVVVKMDVEGAEWDVFASAPDPVLERIDQLVVEFHGTSEARFVAAVRRLKRIFHVAHLHFNNFSCWDGLDPFPAWGYEVLFVSKRLAAVDPSRTPFRPHPLDASNNLRAADCQE